MKANRSIWHYEISRDIEKLRKTLQQEPFSAAYQLGDLQEPFFASTQWYLAEYAGKTSGIILIYNGLSTPCILTWGAPDAIERLLEANVFDFPPKANGKVPDSHFSLFDKYYKMSNIEYMWCMSHAYDEILLSQLIQSAPPSISVKLLDQKTPLESILAVYTDYTGHFFEPSQLESGLYMGLFVEERLVSIAGTHVFSPREQTASLGNVVTAKIHRNKGYGRICIAHLLQELQKAGCTNKTLHVNSQNHAAIACYRKIGFRFHSTLFDMVLAFT